MITARKVLCSDGLCCARPKEGRRDRKKQQTHEAIRASAVQLFTEHGYDNTTIQDITDAADVAQRTFFLHFASKEDVVFGERQNDAAAIMQALRERPASESAYDAVREAILAIVDTDDADLAAYMLLARLIEQSPSLMAGALERYSQMEATFSHEVARRCNLNQHTDTYPALLSAFALTALRVGLTIWARRGGTDRLSDVVAEIFDRLAVGLTQA